MIALHAVRRDISPVQRGLSHYAAGRTFPIMTAAFAALAVAIAAGARLADSWLLGIAAFALAAVAVTPVSEPPRGWRGQAHTAAAMTFFLTAAMGILAASRSPSPLQAGIAWALALFTAIFLVSMTETGGPGRIRGLLQRGCFLLIVAWLVISDYNPGP